jgi:hypothetical protein
MKVSMRFYSMVYCTADICVHLINITLHSQMRIRRVPYLTQYCGIRESTKMLISDLRILWNLGKPP